MIRVLNRQVYVVQDDDDGITLLRALSGHLQKRLLMHEIKTRDRLVEQEEFGSLVIIVYLKQHPRHVRALLLASGESMDVAVLEGSDLKLLHHLLKTLRADGVVTVYGLTTTIPGWLLRLGFREIMRDELPAALRGSEQLRGACPASAKVFAKDLL